MVKPAQLVPGKRYPVIFYVYTEPWGATVLDEYGIADNALFNGEMADEGYVYISIDNRGTPAPKGRAWRKSMHRQIGVLDVKDQAMAAREILKWDFIDPERVGVWGWSGGGSATLNLLYSISRYLQNGIAIAAVANQLTLANTTRSDIWDA